MTILLESQHTSPEAESGVFQGKERDLHSFLQKWMTRTSLRMRVEVLGVVLILTALIILSLGIIMLCVFLIFHEPAPTSVYTGYPIWGSIMFLVSGTLSIAVGSGTTKRLVQGSLGLNIISSVVAATGIILSAFSLTMLSLNSHHCDKSQKPEICAMIRSVLMGMDGLVLTLSVLEFCIAVSLSAFGCKLTKLNSGGDTAGWVQIAKLQVDSGAQTFCTNCRLS
nr:membrane-spanning 4-domains subfamily A member 4A-like isoform X1 [Loxodonta africana]